ncbi:transposase [Staphylococcus hyicus]|nr:transposase [Staphylococcus hyicus]
MNTLIKYLPYILNTIQYSHLINGPIEGINNKILIISRTFVSEYKKRTK